MRRLIFSLLLLPMFVLASAVGGSGLTNLSEGGKLIDNPETEILEHMVSYDTTRIGFVSYLEGYVNVGPVTGWGFQPEPINAVGTPQVLTNSWTSGGMTVTVETKVGGSMDLALKRHDKLVNKTLAYYPVDP